MYIRNQRNSGWPLKAALIGIAAAIATLMCFVGIIYLNTGERRVSAVAEHMIESRCATFSECRVGDGVIDCWSYDVNDIIIHHSLSSDEYPTRGDIDAICSDVSIRRSRI